MCRFAVERGGQGALPKANPRNLMGFLDPFKAVLGVCQPLPRGLKARWFLIESACPRPPFTSPRRGEVDLRSKSGEGALDHRETVTPHPNPLPMGEGAHFRRRYRTI